MDKWKISVKDNEGIIDAIHVLFDLGDILSFSVIMRNRDIPHRADILEHGCKIYFLTAEIEILNLPFEEPFVTIEVSKYSASIVMQNRKIVLENLMHPKSLVYKG